MLRVFLGIDLAINNNKKATVMSSCLFWFVNKVSLFILLVFSIVDKLNDNLSDC